MLLILCHPQHRIKLFLRKNIIQVISYYMFIWSGHLEKAPSQRSQLLDSCPKKIFVAFLNVSCGCSGSRLGTSASHQCGLGSIPSWGSDPGAVSEKGLSSPV